MGAPKLKSLSARLSDWEVVEAYEQWDGTYSGAVKLQGRYGVSWRTLQRAFGRLESRAQAIGLEVRHG